MSNQTTHKSVFALDINTNHPDFVGAAHGQLLQDTVTVGENTKVESTPNSFHSTLHSSEKDKYALLKFFVSIYLCDACVNPLYMCDIALGSRCFWMCLLYC